jgi:FKBP-type peptidyl-prolyl cis-trans isomerase (trigger factor)
MNNASKVIIDQEQSEFFHLGKVVFQKEFCIVAKAKFWILMSKNIAIPGFRSGKAPIHILKSYVEEGFLESHFFDFLMDEYYNDIFDPIRNYPKSIDKSYLNSSIFDASGESEDEYQIHFIVEMAGLINEKNVFLEMPKFDNEQVENKIGNNEVMRQRFKNRFLGENNEYSYSFDPVKIGDKALVECKIYLEGNPKNVISEMESGFVFVGANGLIPEIDKGLIGKKPSLTKRKIKFQYSEDSPSIFAGAKAIYEYKLFGIETPRFKNLAELFGNKRLVETFRSEKELDKWYDDDYKFRKEDGVFSLTKDYVLKQLLQQIPDFELDDSSAKSQSEEVEEEFSNNEINSKALSQDSHLSIKLDTYIGTFEYSESEKIWENVYQANYALKKIEDILSYLFSKYAPSINHAIDKEDYRSDKELIEEIREENPNFEPKEISLELATLQSKQNREKCLDWIVMTLIKKGIFMFK